MALKKEEIDELIKKLRERYHKYADKHSAKWFDVSAFDQRLSMAIRNRMNMEGFILAEISNFEKLRERYEKKKKAKDRSFSREVDKIIEENTARIKKYPPIIFDSRCGIEISHLYGAMTDLTEKYFPVFWIILKDNGLRNMINTMDERLTFFSSPRGSSHAKRIEDHINVINRLGVKEIEIEKDRSDYMKECAFLLHEISDFCSGLMDSGSSDWDYPLSFSKMFIEEKRKQYVMETFHGLTGYGAILKVAEYVQGIIEDFRLTSFRKNSNLS